MNRTTHATAKVRRLTVLVGVVAVVGASSWALGQTLQSSPEPETFTASELGISPEIAAEITKRAAIATPGTPRAVVKQPVEVSGSQVMLPPSVGLSVDFTRAELVHVASWGTTYIVAPGASDNLGLFCVVQSFSQGEAAASVGCSKPEAIKERGGSLLIAQSRRTQTRSGILILPPDERVVEASAAGTPLQRASGIPDRAVVFTALPASVRGFDVRSSAGTRSVVFPDMTATDPGEPVRLAP